jgi:hypothetical protein
MFILQTTTAVLISFLAVLAYEVRNRLTKGRSRRKDLESPGSLRIPIINEVKPPIDNADEQFGSTWTKEEPLNKEMQAHKQLYYKLHNLEHNPEILPESRQLLLSLLSSTLTDAFKEPQTGILSIETFSRVGLDHFLKAKDVDVTDRWEDYLARRKAGGPPEMFSDKEEAKWWLKQAAPVKYVDGAWLGHINKISTPFQYRNITKNAWQVMSEELGDGDLAKNHVHVYRDLMRDIDAGLPSADSQDFIHPRHGLSEGRCWKAAIAQLLISLFPHDFLPEALGFNMAYESLPLHLLKTVKELRELRLNPYYFELHISIDNADSGHAAMAMAAVANYVDLIHHTEGPDAAHTAWKRVQAGYILAEGLPTTPQSPSLKTPVAEDQEEPFPRTNNEAALLDIFSAKSFVAHKIHCNSRLRIGRRSLVDWLEPNAFKSAQWQKDFLHDLGNCRPWVVKGNSQKSRLVKELSWEGKMFGSFTQTEVEVVEAWINELGKPTIQESQQPDGTVYFEFTNRAGFDTAVSTHQDILVDYPVFPTPCSISAFAYPSATPPTDVDISNPPCLSFSKLTLTNLLPLWFTSSTLLEGLPSLPVRASDPFGSAIVRILRAQTGFDVEGLGVAGMDEVRRTDEGQALGIIELGFDICRHSGLPQPANMKAAVALGTPEFVEFAEWMVWVGTRWLTYRDLLVGLTWGFMELHQAVAAELDEAANRTAFLLDQRGRHVLQEIATRERNGLEVCRQEMDGDELRMAEFRRGVGIARRAIGECFLL